MSDKFLNTGGGEVNLSNGSTTLFGATVGAINLDPSQPVRTNSVRQLVSGKLNISEVNNLQSELDTKNKLAFTEESIAPTEEADRVLLYAKTDKKLYYKDDTGAETQIGSGGGGGSGGDATGTWNFDIKTTSPPNDETFFMNNVVPASATSIEIRKVDATGNSFGVLFSTMRNGDQFLFNDGTNKKLYTLTDVGINNSVYFAFPVILESEDNVAQFTDTASITTTILLQNPFNQQLNTTDDVTFNSIETVVGIVLDDTTIPPLPTGDDHTLYMNGHNLYLRDSTGVDEKINNHQNSSTGVQTGGVLSVGTPNTTFSITDGTGNIIVDDPLGTGDITSTPVAWTGKTNIAVTNIGTQLITFILVDNTGTVIQQSSRPTIVERRNNIYLGVLVHVNLTTVDVVNNQQDYSVEPISQLRDLTQAIGFINIEGNVLGDTGSGLTITKGAGSMFATGSNYADNPHAPNTRPLPTIDTSTTGVFQYRMSDGTNTTPDNTDIDPNSYESPLGTLTAVSNSKFTIQRFYSFTSNNLKAQYGQQQYNSLAEAEADLSGTFTTEPSILSNGLLIGYLIVKKGVTNLTTAIAGGDAQFFTASKFGVVQGSTTASTLQNVYDNSSQPQIITSSGVGALIVQNGVLPDTNQVLRINNNAGTESFSIAGDGNISGNALNINSGVLDIANDGTFTFTGASTLVRALNQTSYSIARDGNYPTSMTGGNNILYGNTAGKNITTGYSNVCIGGGAGSNMTEAQACVLIGSASTGSQITTGNNNTVIGAIAGTSITVGTLNTIVGRGAGGSLGIGDNNTFLGATTGTSTSDTNWSICLGASTQVNTDNTCVIGAELSDATSINLIRPGRNGICDLGDSTHLFKDIYLKNQGELKFGAEAYIREDASNHLLIANSTISGRDIVFGTDSYTVKFDDIGSSLRPDTGTVSLGTSAKPWNDIHSNGDITISGSIIGASVKTESAASAVSISPNVDNINMTIVTALAGTLTINNPSGTAKEGQCLIIRIKDNGTTKTLNWGTAYEGIVVNPVTSATVAGKWMYWMCMYNTSSIKWDVIAETIQA